MNSKDKIILILVIGIVSIIGAIVIGEMYMSHSAHNEISPDVTELLKMSVTGLIGVIAGYMGGREERK